MVSFIKILQADASRQQLSGKRLTMKILPTVMALSRHDRKRLRAASWLRHITRSEKKGQRDKTKKKGSPQGGAFVHEKRKGNQNL